MEQDRLATGADLALGRVSELLDGRPGVYLDEREWVIGFWGLTIRPMPYRLLIEDRVLYAWCAWDTLFLPELIGQPARVQSTCPTAGDASVSLSVDGLEVIDVAPSSAVLSFLHRNHPLDADTIATFCHYVHFFADRTAAERWTSEHDGTFVISLADGVEIARLVNEARFPTIRAGRRT